MLVLSDGKQVILTKRLPMFPHLVGLGINEPTQIERYSLRQEAHKDVLKIYFKKQKGELFAKKR